MPDIPHVNEIYVRQERIYMVNIKQDGDQPTEWCKVAEFINEILDLNINQNMTLAKWASTQCHDRDLFMSLNVGCFRIVCMQAARCSLVLSGTSPTIDFQPENIRR